MFEELRFMVVEDKDADREEVLNRLAQAGFTPQNLIGRPATYQDALELIESHSEGLDVVFLDLNLPRNERDSRPEKGHGHSLLKYIHEDLNSRPHTHIRVVIISGEDLLDGVSDELWYHRFKGTLASVAQKANLERTLRASLKRLRRDPILNRLRRLSIPVIDEYESVFNVAAPVRERLEAARLLAIRLVRNEVEYSNGRPGSTDTYADDLHGLIKDFIEGRFLGDNEGRRHVKASMLMKPALWGAFLWRGAMIQHLYSINSYRNLYVHIEEQPYSCEHPNQQAWKVPEEVMQDAERGNSVGEMVAMIVHDILLWYLPWHEQVFAPVSATENANDS
jgi:CheY-like chemotaxis protein